MSLAFSKRVMLSTSSLEMSWVCLVHLYIFQSSSLTHHVSS